MQLGAEAEELSGDTGDAGTGYAERPPREGGWKRTVVHPASDEMETVVCATGMGE